MSKYIDSEKLIAEIERMKKEFSEEFSFSRDIEGAKKERLIESEIHARVKCVVCDKLIGIITSLQREQPETSSSLVDVDAVREDFITEVYRVLDAEDDYDTIIKYLSNLQEIIGNWIGELELEKEKQNKHENNQK